MLQQEEFSVLDGNVKMVGLVCVELAICFGIQNIWHYRVALYMKHYRVLHILKHSIMSQFQFADSLSDYLFKICYLKQLMMPWIHRAFPQPLKLKQCYFLLHEL